MHRLNSTEYDATVQDVLGTTLQPANDSWRGGELGGFDNIASVLGVDESQYDRYLGAAQALARELLASEDLRSSFVACDLGDASCVRSTIAAAGLRLFRRPLEPEELDTYQRVYDTARGPDVGDDESAALTLTLQALLSSAEFLYRIELDPQPESAAAHPLNPYELASRLSYFLWSSAPDDALLRAAADGSLAQPATLSAAVDRMLDDPKSERFITNFAGQWLGARQLPSHPTSPKFYQWSGDMGLSAGQEMLLYFGDFLRSGRSWFEFPTADFNYVDGELAYFYGMPTMPGDPVGSGPPKRVEYHDDKRAGFFGLAGFLALSSLDRRTSPSRRGHWIAGNLLCADLPMPPANVPMLEASGDGVDPSTLSVRQVLERHRADPGCKACHGLFDPYGLALEEYDAIGLYRSIYDDGTPIDPSTTLPPSETHPDGLSFSGLEGLSRAVSSDPNFGACLAKKLFTYGLGKLVVASDEPQLQRAQQEWLTAGQTPSIRRLIQALISTDAFRSRRGGG
jgi:Protein of unknown function (DUF1592)/Protein of unknown function (DUF1588)/Protein of unknown function (DUF1587)/Protein of unknown function (DUF1595)/Protein of unknown function (DUF1585)